MARNVEIKARLPKRVACIQRAEGLSGKPAEVIQQEDVFFSCPSGRLKLRVFSPVSGELIFYQRADAIGPKTSHYSITRTHEPLQLRRVMEQAFGVLATIKKTRLLFLAGRTRIHIDSVEGLGDFIELEVVLNDEEDESIGIEEAVSFMKRLQIDESDLVEGAYVDLMKQAKR
jgi:predicted adenylyl cyclase CyaB